MMLERFKAAFVGIFAELFPERAFLPPAEYRVVKAEGRKLTATPASSRRGLPQIVELPIRGTMASGAASKLKAGTSVVIMFIDGDRARPFLAWIDVDEDPDELALKAQTKAKIDAPQVVINAGVLPVARATDPVVAGPFPGTIVAGSPTVKSG